MTDILLMILIILLSIVLGLLIYLLIKNNKNGSTSNESDVTKLLEKNRIDSVKDLNEHMLNQAREINEFKSLVSGAIVNFEKSNAKELIEFLNQTKAAITHLETEFTLQSKTIKTDSKEQVSELIKSTSKELNELKATIIKEMHESNQKNYTSVNEHNVKTQGHINEQIKVLKEEVRKSLELGFKKNEESLHAFIEKMATLEATTKQMELLQNEISRFNKILNDQKARGSFGEGILEQIFSNIFGDDQEHIFYEKQVNLTKKFGAKPIRTQKQTIEPTVDFIYYLPLEHESLPLSIDAKFPYTNYQMLLDENLTTLELKEQEKLFKANLKERIKEVSKYIIEGITAPYAIMFIPAEAVFIDIYKHYPDIVEEARRLRVILASPSLIITIIQMMQVILKDYKKRNNADKILNLIDGVEVEFNRFVSRFEAHKTRIEQLNKSVEELDVTNKKITNKLEEVKTITSSQHELLEDQKEGD